MAALYAIVTDGKDLMPSFKGELSATERWVVAQYVTSLSPATAAIAE
ncbi:MAG: cytochrome c [Nitrospira sp.]|nr:cytochrome c [Nitrospira sp.]